MAIESGGTAINICTFGTEGTKSAVLTAARGLGIDIDTAQYLTTLIKQERGFLWSLKDCVYGNKEKDRAPIQTLISEFEKYPKLLKVALKIEGLVCRLGVHPCFVKDTLIHTSNGQKPIQDIEIGDVVHTHTGGTGRVLQIQSKQSSNLYTIRPGCMLPATVTGNHPYWTRTPKGEYRWTEVQNLSIDDCIGFPINQNEITTPYGDAMLWLMGRFIGDGWVEAPFRHGKQNLTDRRIIICCSKKGNERQSIEGKLKEAGLPFRVSEFRTAWKILITDLSLFDFFAGFGKYANGKIIPEWALDMPKNKLKILLEGYHSADGHYSKKLNIQTIKTVSKKLAITYIQAVAKVYDRHCAIAVLPQGEDVIEGRRVNRQEKYQISWTVEETKWAKYRIKDNYLWSHIKDILPLEQGDTVYNITVDTDSSYLANGTAVHNCGIVVFNQPSHHSNALMKAPNGLEVTQFDLEDTEFLGGLKFDLLSVEALDKIHTTLDLLVEEGVIERQKTLRETYEKYIGVSSLEYETEDMWKLLWNHQLLDGFQMDSAVAKQAMEKVRPSTIPELAAANSLMRLMPERGEDIPVDTYAKFKNDPRLWIKEMKDAGLTEEEMSVLKEHLQMVYGVANTQEEIMLLSMDKRIANFSIAEANKLRKAVAKKKAKVLAEVKSMFYSKGAGQNVSENMLDYVWDKQIMKQAGYGFSVIHSTAYSLIGLQELNLLYRYPAVYWATACLTVNSGGVGEQKGGVTNYGKIASSIARIKGDGITVKLPDINKAGIDFRPDVEGNAILYGLKGVSEVGDDLITNIIDKRPFVSFDDFLEKVVPTKTQAISLIKAGAFDGLEKGRMRAELLYSYITSLVEQKKRITLQNMSGLINYNLVPVDKNFFVRLFHFNRYMKNLKDGSLLRLDDRAYHFYTQYFDSSFLNSDTKGTYIDKLQWDKTYLNKMSEIKEWLKENSKILIQQLHAAEVGEIWQDVGTGTLSSWEMNTVGFYFHDHELLSVTFEDFNIANFFEQPSEPVATSSFEKKGRVIPIFEIVNIAGTVLDKNSISKTLTLATLQGVVSVKMSDDIFAKYSKQISIFNSQTNKKEIVEKSWFKKGELLIFSGWRYGDRFLARSKKQKNIYPIYRIVDIDDMGVAKVVKYRADD